ARVGVALNLLPLRTDVNQKHSSVAGLPKDPPRVDLVKGVLTHPELKLIANLQKHGPVRGYYFGHDGQGLKDDSTDPVQRILAGMSVDQSRTALADSIVKVLQSKDADPPSAIVVITDGQDNASKYTLHEA